MIKRSNEEKKWRCFDGVRVWFFLSSCHGFIWMVFGFLGVIYSHCIYLSRSQEGICLIYER